MEKIRPLSSGPASKSGIALLPRLLRKQVGIVAGVGSGWKVMPEFGKPGSRQIWGAMLLLSLAGAGLFPPESVQAQRLQPQVYRALSVGTTTPSRAAGS
jgi:hypothetical protein